MDDGEKNLRSEISLPVDQKVEVNQLTEFGELEFNALRSALYPTARRRTFENRHKLAMSIILLSGTAAFVGTLEYWSLPIGIVKCFALAPIVASIADLVFSFSEKARDHQMLQNQFYELLAEMEEREHNKKNLNLWKGKLLRLYAEEDPTMRALDAVAYNSANSSLGRDKLDQIYIPNHHIWLKNWWAFTSHQYQSFAEKKSI